MNDYVQLGELIDSISKTHKFDKEELVFLNTSDVSEGKILINYYSKVKDLKGQAKKTIKNGDILYSEIRPKNRRYAYVKELENPEDYVVSTKLMVLRNKSELLDNDYLYQFLTAESTVNYLQRKAENRIGSFPQITFNVLKQIKISLPEIKIQRQIAKVLSDLDAKIEVNNKINQQLEAMAKTLYDYWFVQFDFPVSTALDMTNHDVSSSAVENDLATTKPYKSAGGKMVYNEELKREIPDGWEVSTILDMVNITTGRLDSNAEVKDGDYHFYTCAAAPSKTDSFAFDDDVILIAGNNASGNFHVNRFSGKFNAYQRTYVVTAKSDEYLDYCYQVITNQMKVLKTRGNGSQTKFLTIGMLNNITVFRTNIDLVKKYSLKIKPLYKKQRNLYEENQKLTELRDWLLPMLMNGQVTVKSHEAGVENEGLGMVAEGGMEYKKGK